MGTYFSCCIKPDSITSLHVRPKKRIRQSHTKKTSSNSGNYWTSACDMENSTMQSQGSVSSIQPFGTQASVSSSDAPSEFVNHGLNLWNQTRHRWLHSKKQTKKGQQSRDPKLSWNATYESLLGTNKRFAQPVPLAEMVDFLVDIWEQEGMYD
ncbi:hypothetical protein RND81_09G123800 [Saponaria officinalis]|uniref:Gag1-like clamp domain-containing protein n=1 Tax=Saponaria officinalis TaxID=3572 RepID=A0AAW1IL37_SAPOF